MTTRLLIIARRLAETIRTRRPTLWQVLLAILIVVHVWYLTRASLRIHYTLGTGAYDLGLYDQGIWLLSRFKAPAVTLIGRNLFGDHTSFILLLLVPLYWIAPGAGTLFLVQSAALSAAAIPVFLLTRRATGREWVAFSVATAYLANPTINLVNTEDFHPDAFLPVLVGLAIWFAVTSRWRPYAITVVLMLLVKEDVVLILVPLGLWVALRHHRTYGIVTAAMSIAYFVFAVAVIHGLSGTGFPNAWRIPFGGFWGLIKTTWTHPGEVVDYLVSGDRPWYLWQIGIPLAFGFLLSPGVAAVAVLVVGSNVVSNFAYQHQIRFHYSAVIVAILFMAVAIGLGRVRGRLLKGAVAVLVACAVWTGYLWSDVGLGRYPRYTEPDSAVATQAQDIIALIPGDAAISVETGIAAHVARRKDVYMFPNPFATAYYGYETSSLPPGTRLPVADTIEYVVVPVHFVDPNPDDPISPLSAWERESPAFQLVARNDHWALWKRR